MGIDSQCWSYVMRKNREPIIWNWCNFWDSPKFVFAWTIHRLIFTYPTLEYVRRYYLRVCDEASASKFYRQNTFLIEKWCVIWEIVWKEKFGNFKLRMPTLWQRKGWYVDGEKHGWEKLPSYKYWLIIKRSNVVVATQIKYD